MSDRPLTEQQQRFVDALMGEAKGNYTKAMRIAGYSESSTVRNVMASEPLRKALIEAAEYTLAINAPKAALGITGVIDDPTALGAKNLVTAAKEVLDRTGIVKTEKMEVKADSGTMFILPPKDD